MVQKKMMHEIQDLKTKGFSLNEIFEYLGNKYPDESTRKKPMNYHRLFEVLNARENRKATIIAAQIPRSDWYDLFRNDTYADACMDRIVKGNYLIELEGPSLR